MLQISRLRRYAIGIALVALGSIAIARIVFPAARPLVTGQGWIQILVHERSHRALVLNDQELETVDLVTAKVLSHASVSTPSTITGLDDGNHDAAWHDEHNALLINVVSGRIICRLHTAQQIANVAADMQIQRGIVFTVAHGIPAQALLFTTRDCRVFSSFSGSLLPTSVTLDRRRHTIFATDTAGHITAFDLQTGRSRRLFYRPHVLLWSSAIDEAAGRLFVMARGIVLMFDTRTERYAGFIGLPAERDPFYSVYVNERRHRLYILDRDLDHSYETLSIVDTRLGRLTTTVPLVNGATDTALGTIALDGRQERLYIATPSKNTISVLDARDGHILKTITVNHPYGLAVDQSLGKLLVVAIKKHVFDELGFPHHDSAVYVFDL